VLRKTGKDDLMKSSLEQLQYVALCCSCKQRNGEMSATAYVLGTKFIGHIDNALLNIAMWYFCAEVCYHGNSALRIRLKICLFSAILKIPSGNFPSFSTIVHVSLQEHSKASEVGWGGGLSEDFT
jgi:hypothetical protein